MRGARRICLHSDGLAFQTVRQAIARFTRREDGTLVYFSLMLFVMMMMMGGFAVDLMRYETIRTSLQNTLDRSTLAAASLTQRLNSTTVVNDYFAKAGLSARRRRVFHIVGSSPSTLSRGWLRFFGRAGPRGLLA